MIREWVLEVMAILHGLGSDSVYNAILMQESLGLDIVYVY